LVRVIPPMVEEVNGPSFDSYLAMLSKFPKE